MVFIDEHLSSMFVPIQLHRTAMLSLGVGLTQNHGCGCSAHSTGFRLSVHGRKLSLVSIVVSTLAIVNDLEAIVFCLIIIVFRPNGFWQKD